MPTTRRPCANSPPKHLHEDIMHLSTHNWMRAEPLEVTLRRIKRLGFESIEISGEPKQYDTKTSRALLKQHGIRCWGAVTLTVGERNLAASNEAQRAASVAYVKSVITMVHELEGTECTIVPATVGKVIPDGTPEEEWKWVVDGLKEVYAHAQKCGVKMAIEPLNRFETYFLNRADQALRLAEDVGPDCGVCLDVFHMNIEEADLGGTIAACGARVGHVHWADSNRRAMGLGHTDGGVVMTGLRAIGYRGWLSGEVLPWPNPSEAAARTIASLRRHLAA